jgi:hypothetical protein
MPESGRAFGVLNIVEISGCLCRPPKFDEIPLAIPKL